MRYKALFPGRWIASALAFWLLAGSLALAQTTAALAPPPIDSNPLVQVGEWLRQGRQFETEHRWDEALAHYEKAMREFPDDLGLKHRYDLTRMHFDVRRRFADVSFRDSIARLSFEQALSLYEEVLVRIQTHYVEIPDWRNLVLEGLENFEIALSEQAFAEHCLANCPTERIEILRRSLRRELNERPIASRAEACDAVAWAAREAHRVLGVSPTAVVLEFNCGATNCLDVYSAYLTPDQLDEVYSQIEGNFVGLGIELRTQDGALTILRVIPRSPAEYVGLRPGDRILAVDGQSVANLCGEKAANLLQGKEGTRVELLVASPGQSPRTLRAERRRVEVPSVDDVKIVDAQRGVGYLRLTCFQKSTASDLDRALWQLHRQGMRTGLIVDLRGNPGGLLIASVEAVDLFVETGTIVSTRGRDIREGFTYSAHAPGTWRVPLIVLIDQDSASAAEIFAGAIRDLRRGTVIGTQSYGKGSVQGIFPLHSHASGMRLTTAKFYSPNGRPYSLVGVKPDIEVRTTARHVDGDLPAPQEDATLAAALDFARNSLSRPGAASQARLQR